MYFEFAGASDPLNPPCKFQGYSQSRALSFYDFSTNLCNLVNLFRDQPGSSYDAPRLKCLFQDESKCGGN